MSQTIIAGLWGLVGGSALLIGAALPFLITFPQRVIAAIMAIGSGVLISAVAFDLIDEAYQQGGFGSAAAGLLGGAIVYTAANLVLSRAGARHRKRSGSNEAERQPPADANRGMAIAVGALLDGIPESIVIGASLLSGGRVSATMVAAVFLSNVPEAIASTAGMRQSGRSRTFILGLWSAIALASGAAAMAGNAFLAGASSQAIAAVTAIAAGAILTMLVDTMIPEATEASQEFSGLIAVAGFLAAFVLSKTGGH